MEFINEEPKQIDYTLKILILGKERIGKSIFAQRLNINNNSKEFFSLDYLSHIRTIGVNYLMKYIKVHNKIFKCNIFDTSGDVKFADILYIYFKNANVILLFYDAFDRSSFQKIKDIYYQNRNIPNCIFALIRTKYELSIQSQNNDYVSDEEAMEYADKNNMLFTHISSFEKYDNGIEQLLNLILIEYLCQNSTNN